MAKYEKSSQNYPSYPFLTGALLDLTGAFSFRTADVEIKLRNRGVDAFKHSDYGDSIIVQRKFNNDGSSQYKLKSKDGMSFYRNNLKYWDR